MAPASRTAVFAKIHKVLKKYYKPVAPPADRPVLEHLLFACCLEDARYEAAEEAFGALVHTFFDWNEVRVTSLSELSEVMASLPDPRMAANRVKRVLHGIFEELYSFDLEDHRKKNLGPTVKWLEKIDGTTRFSVAYVVQSALDGHSIPIDNGTMAVFQILDLATEKEAAAGNIPGLERGVAKSKGIEFGSLVHQLGADFSASPFSQQVREILLQIDPDAGPRFPQRRAPAVRHAAGPEKAEKPAAAESATAQAASTTGRKKKADAAPESEHASPAKHAAESKKGGVAGGKKAPHAPAGEPPAEKSEKAERKTAGDARKEHSHVDHSPKDHPPKDHPRKDHPTAEGLAKRKPR